MWKAFWACKTLSQLVTQINCFNWLGAPAAGGDAAGGAAEEKKEEKKEESEEESDDDMWFGKLLTVFLFQRI